MQPKSEAAAKKVGFGTINDTTSPLVAFDLIAFKHNSDAYLYQSPHLDKQGGWPFHAQKGAAAIVLSPPTPAASPAASAVPRSSESAELDDEVYNPDALRPSAFGLRVSRPI